MVKIYQRTLLSSGLHKDGLKYEEKRKWLLQEDNDSKYRSCLCTAWK